MTENKTRMTKRDRGMTRSARAMTKNKIRMTKRAGGMTRRDRAMTENKTRMTKGPRMIKKGLGNDKERTGQRQVKVIHV
jgi:hypothetical protein